MKSGFVSRKSLHLLPTIWPPRSTIWTPGTGYIVWWSQWASWLNLSLWRTGRIAAVNCVVVYLNTRTFLSSRFELKPSSILAPLCIRVCCRRTLNVLFSGLNSSGAVSTCTISDSDWILIHWFSYIKEFNDFCIQQSHKLAQPVCTLHASHN